MVSTTIAGDLSPQLLATGSDRIFAVRPDSDRRSAVSSVDEMDTGYPSRLVRDFFLWLCCCYCHVFDYLICLLSMLTTGLAGSPDIGQGK